MELPVLQVTADLVIRPDQFPQGFGQKSRDWFVKRLPKSFAMINRLEAEIPAKYKMNLNADDKLKYQKLLRDGRMDLTKRGIYDAEMMSVLKKHVVRLIKPISNVQCLANKLDLKESPEISGLFMYFAVISAIVSHNRNAKLNHDPVPCAYLNLCHTCLHRVEQITTTT